MAVEPGTHLAAQPGGLTINPLEEADIAFAYRLAAEVEVGWLRLYGYGPLAPHTFGEMLWRDVLVIHLARVWGRPVGISSMYEVDFRHGVGWAEVVLVPGVADAVAVREAMVAQLVDSASTEFGLRKLFAAHAGCGEPPLGGLGVEEARLHDCVLHDGWYWDRVVTSITLGTSTPAEDIAR